MYHINYFTFFSLHIIPIIIITFFSLLIKSKNYNWKTLFCNIAMTLCKFHYLCTASPFVWSFGGNFRIVYEIYVFTSISFNPSGNRVFILALNTRHPFTVCPRLTDTGDNCEVTVDSKHHLFRAHPWINEVKIPK